MTASPSRNVPPVAGPLKWCRGCDRDLPVLEFWPHAKTRDRRQQKCKACQSAERRAHREANREAEAARGRAYRARHAERERYRRLAYNRVQQALATGRLVKPDSCERCGAGGRIEGHHENYAEPLDVKWLCTSCHRSHHQALRRAA